MCECGSTNIRIQKTQECSRCYQARRRAENPEAFRATWRTAARESYQPAEMVYTAAVPPTTPCSYDAAHQRVHHYRGSARERVCPCGAQAQEWSYRNSSAYEMEGTRVRNRAGKQELVHSKWSSNITDYDALCIACHDIRDARTFSENQSESPGRAPQFLSLNDHREAL